MASPIVLDEAGTGLPFISVAKSACAVLFAGSQPPTAFTVTSMVREAPGARLLAPVRSFQSKLPAPLPSGAIEADTNWKHVALKVSSNGRLAMAVSPEFCTTMWKTALLPISKDPLVGLTKVLVMARPECVMVTPAELEFVAVPPPFATAVFNAEGEEPVAVKSTVMFVP